VKFLLRYGTLPQIMGRFLGDGAGLSGDVMFAAAASAAAVFAVLAGLLAAVIGISVHLSAAPLITLIAGAATGAFGATVALAAMAANLFFNSPRPPSASPPEPDQPAQ
jgi:hypothetical protein